MPKFRKKPVVIEAVQLLDTIESIKDVESFIEGDSINLNDPTASRVFDEYVDMLRKKGGRIIHTLEGDHLASFGDYVIKGIKGEFYPCKPDIFDASYDPEVLPRGFERVH